MKQPVEKNSSIGRYMAGWNDAQMGRAFDASSADMWYRKGFKDGAK